MYSLGFNKAACCHHCYLRCTFLCYLQLGDMSLVVSFDDTNMLDYAYDIILICLETKTYNNIMPDCTWRNVNKMCANSNK